MDRVSRVARDSRSCHSDYQVNSTPGVVQCMGLDCYNPSLYVDQNSSCGNGNRQVRREYVNR